MKAFASAVAALLVAGAVVLLAAPSAGFQQPDFSGRWELDVEKSEDTENVIRDGVGVTAGRDRRQQERRQLLDRLVLLARALDVIDIEHTDDEFKIFDREDNLRIYYLDGKEHARQTPWGARLQAMSAWDGPRLIITSKGDDVGEFAEIFGMEGRQLVFVVRIKNKQFEEEIVIRHYYDRAE